MKIKKKILASILAIATILCIMAVPSNAADVKVTKVATTTDGSVEFEITGLELKDGTQYQWAIEKSKTAQITNWYDVLNPNYNAKTCEITIDASNKTQLEVLKSTDTAYLTIKEKDTNTKLLDGEQVDLTLDLRKSYIITVKRTDLHDPYGISYEISGVYGIRNTIQYNFVKITDASIINNYVDSNKNTMPVYTLADKPSANDANWKNIINKYPYGTGVPGTEVPTEDGLYVMWIKGQADNVKTIYGYQIVEIGKVEKVTNNQSPSTNNGGTGTSQTPSTNNGGTGTNKAPSTNNGGTGSSKTPTSTNDPTVAKSALPQTGESIAIMGIIAIITIGGVFYYLKVRKYRDIK